MKWAVQQTNIYVGFHKKYPLKPPKARSHIRSAGASPPTPLSLPSLPACTRVGTLPCWEPIVTIPNHQAPSAREGAPSFNSGIMKVMSTSIFVILTGYCHIGSQRGRVPTQVWVEWLDSEGSVGGGAGPADWWCDLAAWGIKTCLP